MAIWIIFAFMTAAAVLAVLWPLGRKAASSPAGGNDLRVYQDQLDEIGRDRDAGLIGQAEAEAARVEVSRRLLAAADAQTPVSSPSRSPAQALLRRRIAAFAAVVAVLILPLGLYLVLGSPNIPGQPAFARVSAPQNQSIDNPVGQVEAHLASNPDDGSGWEVIAPVYLRLGRFDDAVMARRKSLALNGESGARYADLGEALTAAANGVVTGEAKQAFTSAVAHDPNESKARYFLGLADEQDGNREGAAARWRAMLQDAPAGAPWVGFVRSALGRVTGEPVPPAAGPSDADVAAANGMNDDQRAEMIRGMVARLADRLHANGDDVDGWLRLVRAYIVLGDRDKAKGAADDARRALTSRPDDVKRIDDLAKGLGLEG
jgi:cytochrome c-type biogenesis protein CcmH